MMVRNNYFYMSLNYQEHPKFDRAGFQRVTVASGNSADTFAAVTPHDSTNFTQGVARGLYVGVAGNVVAVTTAGTAVTFVGAQAGSIIPILCIRVNSTSTTATNIVALF